MPIPYRSPLRKYMEQIIHAREAGATYQEIADKLMSDHGIKTSYQNVRNVLRAYIKNPDPFKLVVDGVPVNQMIVVKNAPALPKKERPALEDEDVPLTWEEKLTMAQKPASMKEQRYFQENATVEQKREHEKLIFGLTDEVQRTWLCYRMMAAPNLY